MGTHYTMIDLLDMEVEVEVDFDILTYPSSPSGYGFDGSFDPGEGGEIEIRSVRSVRTGDDLTALCAGMHTGEIGACWVYSSPGRGHWRSLWMAMNCGTYPKRSLDCRTVLRHSSNMLADIEAEIFDDPSHFEIDAFEGRYCDDFDD